MDERQLRDAAVLLLDFPGDPARLLAGELGVVETLPLVDEPVGRILLEDRRIAPELALGAVCAASAVLHLDAGGEEVSPRELGLRDRLPHLVGRGLDEQLIDLRGLGRHGRHPVSSSSFLRSASADT